MLSDFASTLEEAVKIADDCGVCQAMVWLADEYLSVMCVTRCKEQNSPLLPWIELKFMLSGIFSSLADLQIPEVRESQGILIDNQGYAIDAEPIKQGHLLRQLARIKETTPADIPFRCIVFFRTRHGVKITLERMLAAAKEGKETMCVSESETGHQQEDLKVLRRRLFSGGATEALKPRKFVGKGTRTLSETNSSQEVTRQAFLKGECNLLLATSVAEEGLDFPACNAVILMDGADHDIALKQRIGRVRADEHGSVVVFVRAQSSEQQRYQQAKSKALNADTALKHIVEVKRGGDSGGGDEKKGKVLLPLYKKTEDRGDRSHSKEGVIELKDARCFVASHSEPTSPLPTTPETGGGGGGNVGGISIKLIFQDDKHYRIQVSVLHSAQKRGKGKLSESVYSNEFA